MGSLRDDILEANNKRTVRCPVARLLTSLTGDDLAALTEFLQDEKVQGSRIAETLRAHGHDVGDEAVRRHRRLACGCSRVAP